MGLWYLEVGATRCDVGMLNSQAVVEERPPMRMNRTDESGHASSGDSGSPCHTITSKFRIMVPYHTIMTKYGSMVSVAAMFE
jgi:hypothetical protein